jgi:large subunit ribosomal protein L19
MAIGDVNRAKLYYLRERVGKKARVREKRYGHGAQLPEVVDSGLLAEDESGLEVADVPDPAVEAEAGIAEAEEAEAAADEAASDETPEASADESTDGDAVPAAQQS